MQNRNISILLLLLALMLPLAGCIDDDSLCPNETMDEDIITFEFTVVTREIVKNGTRSISIPENTLKGFPSENFLDIRNTVFLLFDYNQTLIKVFVPSVTSDSEDYDLYKVRAYITESEFNNLKSESTDDNVSFSIAVLGNYSGLNPQNIAYQVGQKLEDIFNPDKVATFEMPFKNEWIPSINGNNYIPMAGIQTYTVSKDALSKSSISNPLILSSASDGYEDIYMLRALAKIEIIDYIDAVTINGVTTQPERDERISIKNVELVGHTTRGSLFPTYNQWNISNTVETQYVTSTSVPESAQYIGLIPEEDLSTPGATDGSIVNFFADKQATDLRGDGCIVYSCYLTEYNPVELNGTAPMWIRVTAKYPVVDPAFEDYGPDADSSYFRVDVAPYVDGAIQAAIPILRNNIYRFQINKVTPPDQYNNITYTVCPMGDYTSDIPTFE